MSQHDFEILTSDANTGPTIRTQINTALQALASSSSSGVAPGTPYASQLWADTSAGILKMRNTANNGWTVIGELDTDYLGLLSASLANDFTANQKLKGDGLLWRFYDTDTGNEWAIRSDSGVLHFCENTNTENNPAWTVRNSINANGIQSVTNCTEAIDTAKLDTYLPSQTSASGIIIVSSNSGTIPMDCVNTGLDFAKVDGWDLHFGSTSFSQANGVGSLFGVGSMPFGDNRFCAFNITWTTEATSGRFIIHWSKAGNGFYVANSTGATIAGTINWVCTADN